jgi:hypothetical protein
MSMPVNLADLGATLAHHTFAYLMTSRADGPPHAVAVLPQWVDAVLVIHPVGQRTRTNALEHPKVSLVWPPFTIAGFSLIVDGDATVVGEGIHVRPTHAILHRTPA